MNTNQQDNVCKAEGSAVADFLKNDKIHFKELIQHRMNALNK